MYWLAGSAPAGPTAAWDVRGTHVDMQGKWPVGLLRMFAPTLYDLEMQDDVPADNALLWWAKYVVKTIPAYGAKYDAFEGRPHHGVTCLGGSFDLTGWVQRQSRLVNSFDLNALIQMGFCLLPDVNNGKVRLPAWVSMMPVTEMNDDAMLPLGWRENSEIGTEGGAKNFFFLGAGKFKYLSIRSARLFTSSLKFLYQESNRRRGNFLRCHGWSWTVRRI